MVEEPLGTIRETLLRFEACTITIQSKHRKEDQIDLTVVLTPVMGMHGESHRLYVAIVGQGCIEIDPTKGLGLVDLYVSGMLASSVTPLLQLLHLIFPNTKTEHIENEI